MQFPQKLGWRHGVAVTVVTAVLAIVVILTGKKPPPELRQTPPARISVAPVSVTDVAPKVTITGRLRPARRTGLRFLISGQLAQRLVQPGQLVSEGTELLRLDSGDQEDEVARARAQLEQEQAAIERDRALLQLAQDNAALQHKELKRQERLSSESLASRSQMGDTRQKLLNLKGEIARLDYSVETAEERIGLRRVELFRAERNLQRTRLIAPYDGIVNAVYVERGDYVSPTQVALELVDGAFLELHVEMEAEVARELALGTAIDVRVNGRTFRGELIALQRDPDPETFTYAGRIRLASDDGLLPGMTANVNLPLPVREQAIVVPITAVLFEEGKRYVFVVDGKQVRRREVATGVRDGERIVIRQGLDPKAVVAVAAVAALGDGQTIQPVTAEHTEPR